MAQLSIGVPIALEWRSYRIPTSGKYRRRLHPAGVEAVAPTEGFDGRWAAVCAAPQR